MKKLIVLATVAALLLAGVLALVVISLVESSESNTNTSALVVESNVLAQGIERLLLNGKTASAISSKKTAQEVKSLLALQAFDHAQTQAGTKQLARIVTSVENHLDATIRAAVNHAAVEVARQFASQTP